MADRPEFVWVIEREKVFTQKITPYGFFEYQLSTFGGTFEHLLEDAFFMERAHAEMNPQYKQIIPYIIVNTEHGMVETMDEKTYPTFVYQRTPKGQESRLHNMFSIGIGGHINPEDAHEDNLWTFVNGAMRELQEELGVVVDGDKEDFVSLPDQLCEPIGFLNDDSTAVGSVHLGVVCSVLVGEAWIKEEDQLVGEFVYPHQLRVYPKTAIKSKDVMGYEPGEYESWSQFLVDRNEELDVK